jgi:hypothetical protein
MVKHLDLVSTQPLTYHHNPSLSDVNHDSLYDQIVRLELKAKGITFSRAGHGCDVARG